MNQIDKRVHKTNLSASVIEPDKKLKSKKLSFETSEFWFLKGCE